MMKRFCLRGDYVTNFSLFPLPLRRMATAASLSLKPPATFFCGGENGPSSAGISVARFSQGERFHESIVRLSASTVLFIGLSLRVCSPASARLPPPVIVSHSVTESEIDSETVAGEENHVALNEDEERRLEADFEAYKAKVYSLTVPLKVIALRGSVPPSWIKEFMSSQGKRVRLKTRFRANCLHMNKHNCRTHKSPSAASDGTARIWDMRKLQQRASLNDLAHKRVVNSAYKVAARLFKNDNFTG